MIRLKENGILRKKASHLVDELDEISRNNKVDFAVVYGKFMYKAVHSARYITFKLCSSCPYKNEFYETLSNISKLNVQLEWQLLMNFDSLTTTLNFATGIFCLLTG